jgi:hypothetical protein
MRSQWPCARLLRLQVQIPPGAWSVSVVCVVRYRSLRRADHSSRGVLPNVVRRCVRSRNLVNEEAKNQQNTGLAYFRVVFQLHKQHSAISETYEVNVKTLLHL